MARHEMAISFAPGVRWLIESGFERPVYQIEVSMRKTTAHALRP